MYDLQFLRTDEPFHERGEIGITTSPWVSGTRAIAYFGPIRADIFVEDGALEERSEAWYKAECELLEAMRGQARSFGANYVVGLEVTLDPFAENPNGLRLFACGTAAKLEPLRA